MKKNDKSTPVMIKEMIKLYQDGVTLSAIGRKFNMDHTSILYWIQKAKIPLRGKAFSEKDRGEIVKEIGPERQREIKRMIPQKKKKVWIAGFCWNCQKPKTDPKWAET